MKKPSDPVCDTSSCWTAAALSLPAQQQLFKKWRCGDEEAILKGLSGEMDLAFDDMYG